MVSPAQLAGYAADALGYKNYPPDAVVIPADAEELAHFMQCAVGLGVPVCLRGAGTSLSGGPVAAQSGVIVHTSGLRRVRTVCPEGFWCEVECGVAINELDAALEPHGVFYPPDPSSGPVCTLGGNIATNAGGAHCFRYGVTSNYVLGVEVILLDGTVHRFGGPAGGRAARRRRRCRRALAAAAAAAGEGVDVSRNVSGPAHGRGCDSRSGRARVLSGGD